MNAESALQLIGCARESLASAAAKWDATDVSRICECLKGLEQSAAAMEQAEQNLIGGDGSSLVSLRPGILSLRDDVARMGRLVDAAAAFLRGVPGGASPGYGPDGQAFSPAANMESRSMQA